MTIARHDNKKLEQEIAPLLSDKCVFLKEQLWYGIRKGP